MAHAIEIVTGVKFKSEYDTDKVKTVWILKSLSNIEFCECTMNGYVDHFEFVRKGLTGWENFKDVKNKQIPFEEGKISQIPPNILLDLSLKIQNMSSLTEKERKNLRSQSK